MTTLISVKARSYRFGSWRTCFDIGFQTIHRSPLRVAPFPLTYRWSVHGFPTGPRGVREFPTWCRWNLFGDVWIIGMPFFRKYYEHGNHSFETRSLKALALVPHRIFTRPRSRALKAPDKHSPLLDCTTRQRNWSIFQRQTTWSSRISPSPSKLSMYGIACAGEALLLHRCK